MPAVWWSPTRRSGPGVPSSGRTTLPSYGGGDPAPAAKWHFDEVFVTINGTTDYLWRAVDQHGNVLDILVQSRRNAVAAKRFFRKLLKGLRYVPRVIGTDKLASYQVAHRELLPSVTHRRSKYLNNRAENSHQPTRVRERVMKRGSTDVVVGHFRPGSAGQRPPRVSMAMAISASGLWNP